MDKIFRENFYVTIFLQLCISGLIIGIAIFYSSLLMENEDIVLEDQDVTIVLSAVDDFDVMNNLWEHDELKINLSL